MTWRLAEGESFLTAIVSQGKVFYQKDSLSGKSASKRQAVAALQWPAASAQRCEGC